MRVRESEPALYYSNNMKIREFRIPLPMSLEDYHVAQLWAVNEQSRRVVEFSVVPFMLMLNPSSVVQCHVGCTGNG